MGKNCGEFSSNRNTNMNMTNYRISICNTDKDRSLNEIQTKRAKGSLYLKKNTEALGYLTNSPLTSKIHILKTIKFNFYPCMHLGYTILMLPTLSKSK